MILGLGAAELRLAGSMDTSSALADRRLPTAATVELSGIDIRQ